MTTTSQAVATQMSMQGEASDVALSISPEAVANGATVDGLEIDPVTSVLMQLVHHYLAPEEEINAPITNFAGKLAEDEISIQTVKAAEAQEEIAKCIAEIGTLHGAHGSSNW